MNGLDLFSGIGGLAIALSPWVRPIAYCENDLYAQSILLSRMADNILASAPIWDDVRTLRGSDIPPIDMVYGGFPCQDISESGTNRGLGAERSGLYGEIYRLAKEIKPTFLFLENVRAITSRGLDTIGEDMATIGYDCRWEIIPVYIDPKGFEGERWFCLAKATGQRCQAIGPAIGDAPAPALHYSPVQASSWSDHAGEFSGARDGLQIWTHSVRSLGNAVVPHQAREAFMRLMGFDPPLSDIDRYGLEEG